MNPTMKKVILDETHLRLKKHFSAAMLSSMRVNLHDVAGILAEDAVLEFKYGILSENLRQFRYRHPKNWVEAFKERWFPTWLLKRYPVKFTHIKLDAKAYYPEISLPNKEHYVLFHP